MIGMHDYTVNIYIFVKKKKEEEEEKKKRKGTHVT